MAEISSVVHATFLIAVLGLLSKFLGFAREVLIANEFGASTITDAFRASQTIPTLLFAAVGAALATTVIPVVIDVRAKQGEISANRLANNLLVVIGLSALIIAIVGIAFAPLLVRLVVPGFRGAIFNLTVELSRIIMVSLVFVVLTCLLTGFLQARRRFLAPAAIGIPLNITVISSIVLLSSRLDGHVLALSFVLGALAQVLWQLPSLFHTGFRLRPAIDLADPGLRRVAALTLPVVLGTSIQQINVIFDRTFASHLPTGSISVLDYANRLDGLVINVVIGAVATVAYPSLAEAAVGGDGVRLRATFSKAVRGVNFLVLPMTAGLIALSGPITRFVYERGAFTPADTARTAQALIILSIGLLAYGMREIAARVFFSLQDTRTPMINGAYTVLANIVLLVAFVPLLKLGVPGMALATSGAGIFGTGMLLWRLRRKTGGIDAKAVAWSWLRVALAALGMALAALAVHPWAVRLLPGDDAMHQAMQLGLTMLIAGTAYWLLTLVLGVEECRRAAALVRQLAGRLRRPEAGQSAGAAEAAATEPDRLE